MSILNLYTRSTSVSDIVSEMTNRVDNIAFTLLLNISKQIELYTSPVIILDDLTIEINMIEFKGQI